MAVKRAKSKILKISVLLVMLLLLLLTNSYGQSNNILNFETPSYYLMPSEIGDHSNKWVAGTYVNTKKILSNIPLRSYVFSGDYQLRRGFKRLNLGVAFGDVALVSSPYHESELYITVAYHRTIRNQTFHLGIQPGIITRSLNEENLLFPDQYDRNTGGFNASITTNEPIEFSGKALNINLNIGLAYGIKINKYYSKISLAYRNLTKPNLSFAENPLVINRQLIIQNKTEFYISIEDKLNAFLMARTMTGKTEFYLGGEWVHDLIKYNMLMHNISAGAYLALRNRKYPNNMVFNLGFGIKNLNIGMAYSYNFIGNNAYKSDFNSFELVLLFKGLNGALDQYRVPCEIY